MVRASIARRFMLGMPPDDALIGAMGKSRSFSIIDRQNRLNEVCPAEERGEGGGVGDEDSDLAGDEDIFRDQTLEVPQDNMKGGRRAAHSRMQLRH